MTENKNKNAHHYLAKAKEAATEAKKVLRNNFQDDTGIISALNKDIKTKADLTAEKIIKIFLKRQVINFIRRKGDYPGDREVSNS